MKLLLYFLLLVFLIESCNYFGSSPINVVGKIFLKKSPKKQWNLEVHSTNSYGEFLTPVLEGYNVISLQGNDTVLYTLTTKINDTIYFAIHHHSGQGTLKFITIEGHVYDSLTSLGEYKYYFRPR
jgi:hypothetical protein